MTIVQRFLGLHNLVSKDELQVERMVLLAETIVVVTAFTLQEELLHLFGHIYP